MAGDGRVDAATVPLDADPGEWAEAARAAGATTETSALPGAGSSPTPAAARWQRRYLRRLVVGDAAVVLLANVGAVLARFGTSRAARLDGITYDSIALALSVVWILVLFASRAYESRFTGLGSEEYKRVANASLRLAAVIALVSMAAKLDVSRAFLLVSLGVGSVLLLLHRYAARRLLHRDRRAGRSLHRVVVVGSADSTADLIREVRREPVAGFRIVAACIPAAETDVLDVDGVPVPVAGGLADIKQAAERVGADTIAVTGSHGITAQVLRRLAWQLEGSGIDLIVAPALTDIAGPRISIRPVAGLPLLHVEEPEIAGVRYLAKAAIERSIALVAAVLLSPVAVVVAVAVKLGSPGPVFFRQTRVSRHGSEFELVKFRSMHVGAESCLESIRACNDHEDGPLFKIRQDPRVTRVGRWLRRWSIDELPQLWNVIRGDMALIGPRPPLPSEVASYGLDVKRRLLVKPGMTGLWQVSGRSDLCWEDTVRLDLYYVENWSLALDIQILVRTLRAVIAGVGAY